MKKYRESALETVLMYNVIMKILDAKITREDLKSSQIDFGGMVKGVVDVKREIIAIDAELHADLEQLLLENSSEQFDLWGIDLWYDAENEDDFIEFDSMINIRPRQKNFSRGVEDPEIRAKVKEVVFKWIEK